MRILILNWRDIKNPLSGGAEILTHEITKRLVKWGDTVVQFSSIFPNSKLEEKIDGVTIIRQGSPDARKLLNSVHYKAYRYYCQNKNQFDVVIDEIHGLPFFTPWYVKGKKIAFICEVAESIWYKIFGPLFGLVGYVVERFYLRFVYKIIPFVTISVSTKIDLENYGIPSSHINLLPMGISRLPKRIKYKKEKQLTIIFVGRLTIAKGIEDALRAFIIISKKYPKANFWIVGRGNEVYEKLLRLYVEKNKLVGCIIFFSFVSEKKKIELMEKAHILIHPSMKEGFGLTIPEAGSVGTPAVAYNVKGLQDIIRHDVSGILTKNNSPEALAEEIIHLYSNEAIYNKMCFQAERESRKYDWDQTARVFCNVLKNL